MKSGGIIMHLYSNEYYENLKNERIRFCMKLITDGNSFSEIQHALYKWNMEYFGEPLPDFKLKDYIDLAFIRIWKNNVRNTFFEPKKYFNKLNKWIYGKSMSSSEFDELVMKRQFYGF